MKYFQPKTEKSEIAENKAQEEKINRQQEETEART